MSTKNPKIRFDQDSKESDFDYDARLIEHTLLEQKARERDNRKHEKIGSQRYHRAGEPNGTMFSITSAQKAAYRKEAAVETLGTESHRISRSS